MINLKKPGAALVIKSCWVLLILHGCSIPPGSDMTEQLIAQPPSDWVRIYQMNQDGNRISEFIPPDEEALNWKNKVSFESFDDQERADPIELLLYEVEQYQKRCSFVQHFNLFSGFENGYPTSLRLIMCGKSKQLETGEVSMFKAIKGERSFYMIRLARKVEPFEPHKSEVTPAEIAQWSTYMKRILVCVPDSTQHACPQEQKQ
jgi:hypothetical protein